MSEIGVNIHLHHDPKRPIVADTFTCDIPVVRIPSGPDAGLTLYIWDVDSALALVRAATEALRSLESKLPHADERAIREASDRLAESDSDTVTVEMEDGRTILVVNVSKAAD